MLLGDVACPHCGVNLKSGESYEARVKKTKGKEVHPEHFGGRITAIVAVALGITIFAGFMWQRTVDKVFAVQGEIFRYPVQKLQEIDDQIARGYAAQDQGDNTTALRAFKAARNDTDELIQWLKKEDERIKPKAPYAPDEPERYRRKKEPEYNKRVAKKLLRNLIAKAERRQDRLPAL